MQESEMIDKRDLKVQLLSQIDLINSHKNHGPFNVHRQPSTGWRLKILCLEISSQFQLSIESSYLKPSEG